MISRNDKPKEEQLLLASILAAPLASFRSDLLRVRAILLSSMARLFAAFFVALLLCAAAHATLVALVPSEDGLVVAADSRISFLGAECDGAFKIIAPVRPVRTVAIITGDSIFVSPPPAGAANLCRYLETAPRRLNIDTLVRSYLEHSPDDPTQLAFDGLGAACVREVERFRQAYPEALRSFLGRDIFSVVVASYDPASQTSLLRNFVVRIDAGTHRLRVARFTQTAISPHDARGVWIYGETSYVDRHVYAGFGRRFLSPATIGFLRTRALVRDTSLDQAVAVAANIIYAASRAAQTLPPPSGIGGPIRVMLLGSNPQPESVPWAAP
jgi:hypothetical protein